MTAPPSHASVPQISGRQSTLDGVRAVAALAVLVFHVAADAGTMAHQTPGGWVFNAGQVGVPVFFVLSGLLLYRPWAHAALGGRSAPSTGRYLARRAVRILPAYWALVAVVMVAVYREHLTDLDAWAGLLTLTHLYLPQEWYTSGLGPRELGQAWSLSVEVGWYLMLPPTAWLLARLSAGGADVAARARRALWGLAGYALATPLLTGLMFVGGFNPQMGLWPVRYTAWFAIGMALAVVTVWARLEPESAAARFCRSVAASWGACWAAAGSLLVICATPVTGPATLTDLPAPWTSQLHMLLYAACAAFFVAPVAMAAPGHGALEGLLGNAAMRWLGKVSYGVFLWQLLVIQTWFDLTGRLYNGSLLTDLPLLAAASVLAGAACFYLVERPAQRLWHRWAAATSGRRGGAGRAQPSPDRAATVPSPAEPQ